ncbi:MAG TPA: hypothetical protein VM784_15470 [Actinomycetota bacterium]|nr:hypothetical protein [Actinomycetota bacterium]
MKTRRAELMALLAAAACLGASCTSSAPEGAAPGPGTSTAARGDRSPEPLPRTTRTEEPPAFTPDPRDEIPEPIYDLSHGMEAWGVYFIATSYGDPKFRQTIDTLEAIGYKPSFGDVACDEGAAVGLELEKKQRARVALYFASQPAAAEFARRIEPTPIGIARVKLFCLD